MSVPAHDAQLENFNGEKTKPNEDTKPNNVLVVDQTESETGAQASARRVLDPNFRHAHTASVFADKLPGTTVQAPGLMDYISHLESVTKSAESGDLALASRMLAAQATTLDSMFTELARRTALNMGDHINAAERYGRLTLKAQSNCIATLEALAKLHQPHEQTVKHVHVNGGGQAVVADQFHNYSGGAENAKTVNQSHTAGATCTSAPLLSQDTEWKGVPIPGRERQTAVQDARRNQSRCT